MRSKALKILNVAFTVGSQRSTIFPIEDFVRMLMFRNATEAADFIQQHGLTINDGYVLLIFSVVLILTTIFFFPKFFYQCNSVQSYFGDAECLETNALFCLSSSMVELSRTAYQEPDFSLPQRKSVVIERKRTVLIGEVVNGGPLPNPPQHNPVCSFDSNSKYTGDSLSSEPPPAALKGVAAL